MAAHLANFGNPDTEHTLSQGLWGPKKSAISGGVIEGTATAHTKHIPPNTEKRCCARGALPIRRQQLTPPIPEIWGSPLVSPADKGKKWGLASRTT